MARPCAAAASSITALPAAASAGVQKAGSHPSANRPHLSSAAGTLPPSHTSKGRCAGCGETETSVNEPAGPSWLTTSPDHSCSQHRERVLHLLGPRRRGDADGAALAADGQPGHEGQQEVAARQHVQRRHRLGQPHQVAARQQHGRPDLQPRAGARHPGQPDQRVGAGPRQHLGQPERVEAGPGDPQPQRDHRLGAEALPARADADANLHGASSSAAIARVTPASSTSWCVTKRTVSGAMACASTP